MSKKRAAWANISPEERDLPPFHSAVPIDVSDFELEDPMLHIVRAHADVYISHTMGES